MDSISSLSTPGLGFGLSFGSSTPVGTTPSSSGPSTSSIGTAATLELSSLQLQSQELSTLLGGSSVPASTSGSLLGGFGALQPAADPLFTDANTLSLLNAQGSAAMAYVTPQLTPPGQTINGVA